MPPPPPKTEINETNPSTALEIIVDETIRFYMDGITVCRHYNGDAASDAEELVQDRETLTENDLPTVRKVCRQVIDAFVELEARTRTLGELKASCHKTKSELAELERKGEFPNFPQLENVKTQMDKTLAELDKISAMEIDEGDEEDDSYGIGTCAFSYKGVSYCPGAFHDIRGPVTNKPAFVQMIKDYLKEKANQ